MFKLREKIKKIIFPVSLAFFLFLDRWLKIQYLNRQDAFYNYNIALSPIPAGTGFLLLAVLVLVYLVVEFVRCWRREERLMCYALGFIIIGALSNFFDRFQYGAVVDYWHTLLTVFNLADVGILVGLFMILWKTISRSKKV